MFLFRRPIFESRSLILAFCKESNTSLKDIIFCYSSFFLLSWHGRCTSDLQGFIMFSVYYVYILLFNFLCFAARELLSFINLSRTLRIGYFFTNSSGFKQALEYCCFAYLAEGSRAETSLVLLGTSIFLSKVPAE